MGELAAQDLKLISKRFEPDQARLEGLRYDPQKTSAAKKVPQSIRNPEEEQDKNEHAQRLPAIRQEQAERAIPLPNQGRRFNLNQYDLVICGRTQNQSTEGSQPGDATGVVHHPARRDQKNLIDQLLFANQNITGGQLKQRAHIAADSQPGADREKEERARCPSQNQRIKSGNDELLTDHAEKESKISFLIY